MNHARGVASGVFPLRRIGNNQPNGGGEDADMLVVRIALNNHIQGNVANEFIGANVAIEVRRPIVQRLPGQHFANGWFEAEIFGGFDYVGMQQRNPQVQNVVQPQNDFGRVLEPIQVVEEVLPELVESVLPPSPVESVVIPVIDLSDDEDESGPYKSTSSNNPEKRFQREKLTEHRGHPYKTGQGMHNKNLNAIPAWREWMRAQKEKQRKLQPEISGMKLRNQKEINSSGKKS